MSEVEQRLDRIGAVEAIAPNPLAAIDQARTLLEAASTPQETGRIADFAEAMRVTVKKAKLGLDAQNQAAELKLDAQRKGGEMLTLREPQSPKLAGKDAFGNYMMKGPKDNEPTLIELGISDRESMEWRVLWRIPAERYERRKAEIRAAGDELTTAGMFRFARELMGVHYSSDSPEWRTPPGLIAKVVEVLGEIDLDPCADAELCVPATRHYTIVEDGLTLPWEGSVYMNPPYGKEIGDWTAKLTSEFEASRVSEAIALVPSRTDTLWFSELRDYPRCFILGRLKFSDHRDSAPFPSAVFYLGDAQEKFADVFSDLGDIFERSH